MPVDLTLKLPLCSVASVRIVTSDIVLESRLVFSRAADLTIGELQ